jgi:hypothetical protein
MSIDDDVRESSTQKIDCYRNRVGLEIESNAKSKDLTYIRDRDTFRILFDMQINDVGSLSPIRIIFKKSSRASAQASA